MQLQKEIRNVYTKQSQVVKKGIVSHITKAQG